MRCYKQKSWSAPRAIPVVLRFPQQKGGAEEHPGELGTAGDSWGQLCSPQPLLQQPLPRESISFADSPHMPGAFLHHLVPVSLTETLFWMQKPDALFLEKRLYRTNVRIHLSLIFGQVHISWFI